MAGAVLASIVVVAAGYLLRAAGAAAPAEALRGFLAAGGWVRIPLWGAALGALAASRWARGRNARIGTLLLSLALAALSLVLHPEVQEWRPVERPRSARAKASAIRRWAYRSPATVANIFPYSRDPDPVVREQAVLALGINLIVSSLEHASATRPARFLDHPLRDSLRIRLLAALEDPAEGVRAEAARALVRAPRSFGPQPAAAETLAAVLGRALRPQAVERLAWLALDAAAGSSDSALKAAAARFAAATPDTALARAARFAATRVPGR